MRPLDSGWDSIRAKTKVLAVLAAIFAAFGAFWVYHGIRALIDARFLYALFYFPAVIGCFVVSILTVVVMRQQLSNSAVPRSAITLGPSSISFAMPRTLVCGYWLVFGLAFVASIVLAVGMWTDALTFPMSAGFDVVLPFVALALALYAGLALIWFALGYARFPRIDCTPESLVVQGFKARQQIGWSDLAAVEPVGVNNNLGLLITLADGARAQVDINYVGPLAPTERDLRQSITVAADLFAVGAEQLLDFLSFYVENPSARDELGDERAVDRLGA